MAKCNHEPRYTGKIRDGKYLYKCTTCDEEILLDHAVEDIRNAPTIQGTGGEEQESAPSYDSADEKSKTSSDYHKRRYQLIKSGQWTGSLKNG